MRSIKQDGVGWGRQIMTLASLRPFRPLSIVVAGALATPGFAAERKPVPLPSVATASNLPSPAMRLASPNPTKKVAYASKRNITGAAERKPIASPRIASARNSSSPAARLGPPKPTRKVYASQPRSVGPRSPAAQNQQKTASGEVFAPNELIVRPASPFGTWLPVTNLVVGQSVTIKVNDQGSYVVGRAVDVSQAVAQPVAIVGQGVARKAPPNPNRKVTYASKQQIAGHGDLTAKNKQASASAAPSSGVANSYSIRQETTRGERFAPSELTAAHATSPFGTRVRVTNLTNAQSVTVGSSHGDRYVTDRVVNISRSAAKIVGPGVARQAPANPTRKVTYASKRHIAGHHSPFVQNKPASAPAVARNSWPRRAATSSANRNRTHASGITPISTPHSTETSRRPHRRTFLPVWRVSIRANKRPRTVRIFLQTS